MIVATVALPQSVLVNIDHISPKDVEVQGFRLDSQQQVEIDAVGFRDSGKKGVRLTRAWILDARTRQQVWGMDDAETQDRGRRLVEYHDQVSLPEGDYEVYYSSFPYAYRDDGFNHWFSKWFHDVFDGDDDEAYHHFRKDWQEFKITVRGKGKAYVRNKLDELRSGFLQSAFVSMRGLRDGERVKQGFKLSRPVGVEIYAVGEARRDGTYDYGWIVNSRTREKAWMFDYRNSEYAGGARKNRVVRETVRLEEGEYEAVFVTDDSHSSSHWNSAPPNDPDFWGMTVMAVEPSDNKFISDFDRKAADDKSVILAFTQLRNNEFKSQSFRCNSPTDVRVYAVGEGGRDEMYDFSWIVNAGSHERVWRMDYDNTEHAGGGKKNRVVDDVLQLQKGSYTLYCVTDGSHSYWDWNDEPPFDREGWGVTLMAADESYRPGDIEAVDDDDVSNGQIIARLTGVQNYEHERDRFSLDRDGEVRIYAVGEGSGGDMHDYGWIENAETDKTVWEMTYRQTDHAGGAKKNRLFDGKVYLQRGRYVLHYETDGSHSFEQWNDKAPYDPASWGITIYRVEP